MIAASIMIAIGLLGNGKAEVPRWVEPLTRRLIKVGLLPRNVEHGRPTRHGYAVTTNAVYVKLRKDVSLIEANKSVGGKVDRWWLEVDGVIALFHEFNPELKSMGAFGKRTDKDYLQDLRSYQSKLTFVGRQKKSTPSWVQIGLERFHRDGIVVGYPSEWRRPPTRYEWAVAAHATWMHIQNLIDGGDLNRGPAGDIRASIEAISLLGMTFDEFRLELTAMGVYETTTVAQIHTEMRRRRAQLSALIRSKSSR